MLYELRNLRKTYGRRTVLDIEELFLPAGKVLGILGPNGAGKTTLLEILAFLQPATSGEIRFNGSRVDFSTNSLINLRRKVVIVGQHPILFTATVSKNLEFPLGIRKFPKPNREKIIDVEIHLRDRNIRVIYRKVIQFVDIAYSPLENRRLLNRNTKYQPLFTFVDRHILSANPCLYYVGMVHEDLF